MFLSSRAFFEAVEYFSRRKMQESLFSSHVFEISRVIHFSSLLIWIRLNEPEYKQILIDFNLITAWNVQA